MRIRSVRLLLLVVLTLSLGAGATGPIAAQETTPAGSDQADRVTVLPPDEPAYGATLGEWSARWWQWTVSFPMEINPGFDPTGARCAFGQHGPVFFLPENFAPEAAEVTCTVPLGTAVFVPIIGTECSTVEPPPFFGGDEEELRDCAEAASEDFSVLAVRVDGEEVADPEQYWSISPLFTLNLPENNLLNVPAGVASSVAAGYDMILAPLPEGEHEIHTRAEAAIERETVTIETTYRVIVVAPQVIEPAATPTAGTPVATPET